MTLSFSKILELLLFSFEKDNRILDPESESEFLLYIRLDSYKSQLYSQLEDTILVFRYKFEDE